MSNQVAATAAAFLSGKTDPLTTIRRTLRILGDVDRCSDPDLKAIAEIDRATAHGRPLTFPTPNTGNSGTLLLSQPRTSRSRRTFGVRSPHSAKRASTSSRSGAS
jgi:hypothetical protein